MAEIEEYNFLKSFVPEDFLNKLYEKNSVIKLTKIIKHNWKSYGYVIAVLVAIIGFVTGYIGYYKEFLGQIELQNPSNIIFQVMRLYILQNEIQPPNPWELELAKYLCPISFSYSVILAFMSLFQKNLRIFRLQFFKNHIVICGLNNWTSQLISDLRRKDNHIVVIEKEIKDEFKMKVQDLGAIILNGDCADSYMLNKANIFKAKYLVAFTNNDSKNMETAINAKKMIESQKIKSKGVKKLKCFIHIKDKRLYDSFSKHNIFQENSDKLEMKIFNNYQNDARVLFLSSPFDTEVDTKAKGVIVHLLIVGFGYLGESVLLQAAKMGHYANEEGIKITIIDENAEELRDQFLYHYPEILKVKTCESSFDLTFVNLNLKNLKEVEDKIKSINEKQNITAIIICLEEETNTIKFGLDLISMLESEGIPIRLHLPIRVYLDENEDIFKLQKTYPITPFGLIRSTCSREIVLKEILDKIAKALHDDYKQKQEENGKTKEDNPYLVDWDKLPPDIKDSNRQQADHLPIKLRALNIQIAKKKGKNIKPFEGFKEGEIEKLARMEHNRWCAERWISGWKYSKEKNPEKKLHPLLIPYDELDEENQKTDFNFIRTIPKLLELLELELIRTDK